MRFVADLIGQASLQVLVSLSHNWPFLLASIFIAAALKALVEPGKISGILKRFRGAGVFAATGLAVATPLCSCGTTAVVLGMMASTIPWAPIVAFMVASPLSSPEGMVYSAGLFGWRFAIASFTASILLGLAGGAVAALLEKEGFLVGQARLALPETSPSTQAFSPLGLRPAFASALAPTTAAGTCGCSSRTAAPVRTDKSFGFGFGFSAAALIREAWKVAKRLLPMFLGFAFIGYLINDLVPASWISALFGRGHAYGVPLAATIGLPLYVNSEASLPMARALMDSGMSQGAIMAFLIAGSGTSMGAIAGALTIARWKVVGLVVAVLWVGAILAGYGFDLMVATGLA
jgi:uncharacterized membrane protein YraQ (UPF0718 family)